MAQDIEKLTNGLYKKNAEGVYTNVFDGTTYSGPGYVDGVKEVVVEVNENPSADLDNNNEYDEFTDNKLHKKLEKAGWSEEKIDEIKGVMKGARLNRERKLLEEKKKKPTPPPILRYPFEGMTQHTDYLQIDIVEYKPAGKERSKKGSGEWGTIGTEIIKGTDGTEYTNKVAGNLRTAKDGAKFKGKMGGRRNSLNRSVGRTRSYALSRRPLKNEGTILLPIPSNVQDGNSIKVGENSLNGLKAAGASGIMDAMTPDFTKNIKGIKDDA